MYWCILCSVHFVGFNAVYYIVCTGVYYVMCTIYIVFTGVCTIVVLCTSSVFNQYVETIIFTYIRYIIVNTIHLYSIVYLENGLRLIY